MSKHQITATVSNTGQLMFCSGCSTHVAIPIAKIVFRRADLSLCEKCARQLFTAMENLDWEDAK